MDEMQDFEINDLIENIQYLDRNMWECARLNAYITAQSNSTKTLKMQDICKFSWEDKVETHDTSISNADIERLKQKAEMIKQIMKNEI